MARRSRAEELLEFEIAFYQKLLHAYPDFVDVLIPLGEAYTRRGLHEKGLEVDLRLSQLRGEDPVVWYNLACSYSLLQKAEESAQALCRAIEMGYGDFEHLRKDPDLAYLKRAPAYRQVLDLLAHLTNSQPIKPTPEAAA